MELQKLLTECKNKSITAQKYLFDKLSMQMFVVCRRYMKTDHIAEEVMMNGFLKVFRTLHNFVYTNDAATIGWIRKIMVNECLMQLRKTNSFLFVEEREAAEISIDEDAIESISAGEILKLIVQLPPGYRTVFNLYVMEEMGHKEIAKQLGISEGTSKSQLSKAKQMLQQLLIKSNVDYAARKVQ